MISKLQENSCNQSSGNRGNYAFETFALDLFAIRPRVRRGSAEKIEYAAAGLFEVFPNVPMIYQTNERMARLDGVIQTTTDPKILALLNREWWREWIRLNKDKVKKK